MRYRSLLGALLLVACSTEKRLGAACEAGDPSACDVLSAHYAAGEGVGKDPARALQLAARTAELCARAAGDAGASATCARFPNAKSVPLDLPAAPRGSEMQTIFSVVLAADGTTEIDGKPAPNDEAIAAAAKAAHTQNPEVRAVIKADAAAPHGRVIHVLDLLKQAQIGKIAFGVSPVAPP